MIRLKSYLGDFGAMPHKVDQGIRLLLPILAKMAGRSIRIMAYEVPGIQVILEAREATLL
jgi:hypothetical protein